MLDLQKTIKDNKAEWYDIAKAPRSPGDLVRAKVTQVMNGTLVMSQYDKFKPEGFSGAPVITAENNVIGTMLASGAEGDMRQGAMLANIKRRIEGR